MSDYRINFGNVVGPSDTNKLYDMLDILGEEDELLITVDAAGESPQYNTIIRVLEENKFNVSTKGGHESGQYHIFVKK